MVRVISNALKVCAKRCASAKPLGLVLNGNTLGDKHPKWALLDPAQLKKTVNPRSQETGITGLRTDNL